MKNGLYAVQFGVGATGDKGSGVIIFRDGQVRGGDAGYAYIGEVTRSGDDLRGHLEIFQHQPGHPSVFGGAGSFNLQVVGKATGEETAGFHGESPSFSGMALKVSMQLLRAD